MGCTESDVVDIKVLRLLPHKATVYIVAKGYGTPTNYDGLLIWLVRENGKWKYTGDYAAAWSDTGSADGNVFPPYRNEGGWGRYRD
jgi:hypothetical protein